MIGSMDENWNLNVYLDPIEINRLEKEAVKNDLIRTLMHNEPKQYGKLFMIVNGSEGLDSAGAVTRNWDSESNFELEISISEKNLQRLKTDRYVSLDYKHGSDKSKLKIYDIAFLDRIAGHEFDSLSRDVKLKPKS